MDYFHFIFDVPPAQPTACSALRDVFAWSVWRAMDLGVKDLVFEESEHGLVVACLDDRRKESPRRPEYRQLARFLHLRGSALSVCPARASGTATRGDMRWSVRLWTCYRGDSSRLCTVVQLVAATPA